MSTTRRSTKATAAKKATRAKESENAVTRDNAIAAVSAEPPSQSKIAECAYSLWERGGQAHGRDVDDWLRAEALLQPTTVYDIILVDPGERRIELVRELRAATGLTLKKIKSIIEATPETILSGVRQHEAEALLQLLQTNGAKAELRPLN